MKKIPKAPRPRSLPTRHRTIRKSDPAKRQSNILDHSFCPETGCLTITFRGGRRYRYEGVGKATAEAFAGADSKGRFLNNSIVGKHGCTKIDP